MHDDLYQLGMSIFMLSTPVLYLALEAVQASLSVRVCTPQRLALERAHTDFCGDPGNCSCARHGRELTSFVYFVGRGGAQSRAYMQVSVGHQKIAAVLHLVRD